MTQRVPYEPGREFVAARPIKFGGVDFQAGQDFPWQDLGCTERRLRQMFDARQVAVKGDSSVVQPHHPPDPRPPRRPAPRREP